jgi:hypothetical protein
VCYSAQVRANYRKYTPAWGGHQFEGVLPDLWLRDQGAKIRIPKAVDAAVNDRQSEEERKIKALIDAFNERETTQFEQRLFKQRKRLADAERTLQGKTTKAATESRRIAAEKVEWCLTKPSDQRRGFAHLPGWYASVIAMKEGRRIVVPMRYQCRLPNKPATYDTKFPGTYNACRDEGQ